MRNYTENYYTYMRHISNWNEITREKSEKRETFYFLQCVRCCCNWFFFLLLTFQHNFHIHVICHSNCIWATVENYLFKTTSTNWLYKFVTYQTKILWEKNGFSDLFTLLSLCLFDDAKPMSIKKISIHTDSSSCCYAHTHSCQHRWLPYKAMHYIIAKKTLYGITAVLNAIYWK